MRRPWRFAAALACAAALAVYAVPTAPPGTDPGSLLGPAAASAHSAATIVIGPDAAQKGFQTREVTMAGGGMLSVVNLDGIDHTVTSVAVDASGEPLFDVRTPPGSTVSIPAAAGLAPGRYDFFCTFHPHMRGTLVVEGGGGGVEPVRPEFRQPLVVPRVLSGSRLRVRMREAPVRVLPDGPATRMWTYGGSWPGPTIRRRAGRHTRVTFRNDLPRRAGAMSVHLHGDHHAPEHDGQPQTHLVRRGKARTYDYPLTFGGKPEPSSFFWYHDHRMDHTTRNNWRGLQGMFLVTDGKDLRLPTGVRDVPLLVGDRSFTDDNQLANPFAHGPAMHHHGGKMMFTGPNAPPNDITVGTHVLVNGRYAPYLDVTATRYRLRLLNASPFTAYNFALSDGRPFVQIGTGNGLLREPVVRDTIVLGPSQRADVLVDFHGEVGQRVVLESVPLPPGTPGTGVRETSLMEFRVLRKADDRSRLPASLPGPVPVRAPSRVSKTWTFDLHGNPDTGSFWGINGKTFVDTRMDHRVRLGSTERWRLRNTSDMTHYVHIHAEQWRTVRRDGKRPPPWERGLEDTWRVDPGEVVDVAARFEDYTGPFMIHCHMLDHEDHGMMARFEVLPPR
ncbi:hypothetical protein DDE18_08800 [Nocardioides gansuensis]|uniref:Copper oxidase n=1 Tax=Nocardioides gansuensis TaxID=2138300 RepID=A0A2T8FCE5_9ACTN|nr:multicopper oxidase domain-containing protein [Nocardioides gansuensis]PVG83380.1 hypothetical protein DDE18_08800 [Nocardioides gansuensis]